MSESLTKPRIRLGLDTDWQAAFVMGLFLVLCALLSARTMLQVIHSAKPAIGVNWQSWVLLAMCTLVFLRTPERWFRVISGVLGLGIGSRILLHLLRADMDTQIANAAFLRVLDLMLFGGSCVYALWWFKSKIRYV